MGQGSRYGHAAPVLRILSDESWITLQDLIFACDVKAQPSGSADHNRRGGQPKYLFSGFLVCAVCGSRFTVSGIQRSQRYICG
jgi:hypothetical protein